MCFAKKKSGPVHAVFRRLDEVQQGMPFPLREFGLPDAAMHGPGKMLMSAMQVSLAFNWWLRSPLQTRVSQMLQRDLIQPNVDANATASWQQSAAEAIFIDGQHDAASLFKPSPCRMYYA